MSLWIKICGNTCAKDALASAEAGADAVGFVFAPSSRRADPQTVAAITPLLAGRVESIGVFVQTPADEIAALVDHCRLTGVQLHAYNAATTQAVHANASPESAQKSVETAHFLRTRFGPDLRILRAVHYGPHAALQLAAIAKDGLSDAALIDTRIGQRVGGTGVPFDWQTAAKTLFAGSQSLRLIAAGGLKPENVAEAVTLLRPWGVDVASGVEARPGIKDHTRVRDLIRLARLAATKPRPM
jgi:phosphoribosylanthranilate isomerase